MTAAETLAAFLDLRGDVLTDAGRIAEAQVAYAQSYRLSPDNIVHLLDLAATVDRELERLARKDYLALGQRISYAVCSSMDPEDLKNVWIYHYPKPPVRIPVVNPRKNRQSTLKYLYGEKP